MVSLDVHDLNDNELLVLCLWNTNLVSEMSSSLSWWILIYPWWVQSVRYLYNWYHWWLHDVYTEIIKIKVKCWFTKCCGHCTCIAHFVHVQKIRDDPATHVVSEYQKTIIYLARYVILQKTISLHSEIHHTYFIIMDQTFGPGKQHGSVPQCLWFREPWSHLLPWLENGSFPAWLGSHFLLCILL